MTSRRALLLGIGVLVTLQLLTSFTAIGVLTRMSPAIERILQENEYSIEAAELLLSELAAAAGAASPDARARATAALERIRHNVTEQEELEPIGRIEEQLEAALQGDGAALAELVDAANRLVAINRAAMREADLDAQRLGTGGAWAAVVLAVVAFLLSLVVARRLERRLLEPLRELESVLGEARLGTSRRRCRIGDAAPDVRRVLDGANALLDSRALQHVPGPSRAETAARSALLGFLDERDAPTFVVDRDGTVAAANSGGLARLSGPEGAALRGAFAALADGGEGELPIRSSPLRNEAGWLVQLEAGAGNSPRGEAG